SERLEEEVFLGRPESYTGRHAVRHIDTDVRDDFSISYNEDDVDRIAEHIILLRKPPQPLLYLCGLTMDCRHPELSHVIKDPEGQVIAIDDFLKLPHWNGTLMKDTIFVAPIHHTIPKPLNETIGPKRKGIEVSVVNLSNHTQETTSPLVVKTLNEQIIQDDHQVKDTHISDGNSFIPFHSIHEEDNDEDADNHRYSPSEPPKEKYGQITSAKLSRSKPDMYSEEVARIRRSNLRRSQSELVILKIKAHLPSRTCLRKFTSTLALSVGPTSQSTLSRKRLVDSPIILEARIKGYQFRRIYVDRGSSSEVMYEHCFRNLGHDIKAKLRDSSVPLVGFSGEVNVNNKITITKDDPEVGEDKINA
ncbi:hypothetical protein Tco_0787570, partial [Tanacetum coccineum]